MWGRKTAIVQLSTAHVSCCSLRQCAWGCCAAGSCGSAVSFNGCTPWGCISAAWQWAEWGPPSVLQPSTQVLPFAPMGCFPLPFLCRGAAVLLWVQIWTRPHELHCVGSQQWAAAPPPPAPPTLCSPPVGGTSASFLSGSRAVWSSDIIKISWFNNRNSERHQGE